MFYKGMGFADELISKLNDVVATRYEGYPSRLAKDASTHTTTLIRLLEGERSTWLSALGRVADAAGLRVTMPEEKRDTTRDVCWVDAHIAPAGQHAAPPRAENYRAVPLVGEAGAGGGIIPQDEIKSWVLVYQHHQSVQFRRNLLAVEVGRDQTSMEPTLHPLDIVMVDRDDFRPDRPGGIFLVREPGQDGGGKIKRVSTKQKNGETQIIFYSDNAAEHPPETYILQHDYDGDIRKAIIGRVVWAWSDMTRK